MKKRHRLEKIFQSVFGDHDDAENSKHLPNREDMDKNVEKILKILRMEESGAISSDNMVDKSELASLIDSLHNGYQVVHGRYDLLMGKLKKRIRPKSVDKGSFSIDFISSDSESLDSGSEEFEEKKKFNKAQEAKAEYVSSENHHNVQKQLDDMKIRNNELETIAIEVSAKLKEEQTFAVEFAEHAKVLQAEMDVLRKELEDSVKREDDTNQMLGNLCKENESLRSENAKAFIRIREADKSIEEFQIELKQIKDDMERVKSENSILKVELEKTSNEVASLDEQLISSTEEKEALRSGNFEFLKRMQEAEKSLSAFKDQADQKTKSVTEELKSQNVKLASENENLKLKLEAAGEEIGSLKSEILRLSSLIQVAEKISVDLTTESVHLKDENLKLLNINNDLDQQLKVKVIENEALASERLEAVEMNSILVVEIEVLKDQYSKLLADFETMKQELGATNDRVTELKQTLELKEDEMESSTKENSALLSKIQQAEKAIDDLKAETEQQKDYNSQLQTKINDWVSKFEEASSNLSDLQKQLTAAEEEKRALGLEISGLMMKLHEMEINRSELENGLKHLRGEISMLQQNHQAKAQESEKIIDDLNIDNSQLKATVSALGLELEAYHLKLTDLNRILATVEEEKKTLVSENYTILSRLQQAETNAEKLENDARQMRGENSTLRQNKSKLQYAEKITDELKDEIKQLRDDNSKLQFKIEDLSLELEAANLHLVDLKKVIVAAEEEKTSLTSEIVMMKGELQKFEINVQTLEAVMVRLQEENSVLEYNHNKLKCQKIECEGKLEEKEKETRKLDESCKELLEKLEHVEAEKTLLTSEIETVKGELHQEDLKVQTLESELRKLQEENSMLKHNQNELQRQKIDLEGKFEDKEKEMGALVERYKEPLEKVEVTEAEKVTLISEIEVMKGELQRVKLNGQRLDAEVGKLQEENSFLECNKNDLQLQKIELEGRLEEKEKEVNKLEENCKELRGKLEFTEAEKYSLASEIETIKGELEQVELNVQTLEAELGKVQEENSMLEQNQKDLEGKLKEKEIEINRLEVNCKEFLEKLEFTEAEKASLASEIVTFKGKVQHEELIVQRLDGELRNLQEENSVLEPNENDLQHQKIELEEKLREKEIEVGQLEESCKELVEKLELKEAEKTSLASEIVSMKDEVQKAELNVQTLMADLEKLKEEKSMLEHSQNELHGQKVELEEKILEREKEMGRLEESCKELLEKLELAEAQKADKDGENAKLIKQVQTIEVQLRLSNQKLKISETENKAKQEACMKTMKEMNEERRVIEEQMLKLSMKINFLENNARQLKEVYKVGVSALANRYQGLESVVQESSATMLKQLSMCSKELKVLKKQITAQENEKQDLVVGLECKEGIISMMKDESESIRDKLAEKEKAIAILRANSVRSGERTRMLEEMLREKEEEMLHKDEAKREAIRQLCLLMEYYRENCDHLYTYLCAVRRRSVRSS